MLTAARTCCLWDHSHCQARERTGEFLFLLRGQDRRNRRQIFNPFVRLVADGWCWFVLREKYCWLVGDGWFVLREKYCWLVADKPNEQGVWSRESTREAVAFMTNQVCTAEKRLCAALLYWAYIGVWIIGYIVILYKIDCGRFFNDHKIGISSFWWTNILKPRGFHVKNRTWLL
jgi:hypothetical protein